MTTDATITTGDIPPVPFPAAIADNSTGRYKIAMYLHMVGINDGKPLQALYPFCTDDIEMYRENFVLYHDYARKFAKAMSVMNSPENVDKMREQIKKCSDPVSLEATKLSAFLRDVGIHAALPMDKFPLEDTIGWDPEEEKGSNEDLPVIKEIRLILHTYEAYAADDPLNPVKDNVTVAQTIPGPDQDAVKQAMFISSMTTCVAEMGKYLLKAMQEWAKGTNSPINVQYKAEEPAQSLMDAVTRNAFRRTGNVTLIKA